MNTTAFQPTLLESECLLSRLVIEVRMAIPYARKSINEFMANPVDASRQFLLALRKIFTVPHRPTALASSIIIVCLVVLSVFLVEKASGPGLASRLPKDNDESDGLTTVALINVTAMPGVGVGGEGRVGLNHDRGEGSKAQKQKSGGGGSGGNHDLAPAQQGKLPIPSEIQAAIFKTPLAIAPSLPVAGVDLDPALWRETKFPVYGDPRSKSEVSSNGPGDGGGMGTNHGTGFGGVEGPGFGPGKWGNTGGDKRQLGCCGAGASTGNNPEGWEKQPLRVSEVETRPRVISKPEPQYTEEARRNQMMGTVVLRVIFASTGEVTHIQAVKTLAFGLTERAIAAAHQIRFIPAQRGGLPVSVYMQLEYNFNLY